MLYGFDSWTRRFIAKDYAQLPIQYLLNEYTAGLIDIAPMVEPSNKGTLFPHTFNSKLIHCRRPILNSVSRGFLNKRFINSCSSVFKYYQHIFN